MTPRHSDEELETEAPADQDYSSEVEAYKARVRRDKLAELGERVLAILRPDIEKPRRDVISVAFDIESAALSLGLLGAACGHMVKTPGSECSVCADERLASVERARSLGLLEDKGGAS